MIVEGYRDYTQTQCYSPTSTMAWYPCCETEGLRRVRIGGIVYNTVWQLSFWLENILGMNKETKNNK